MRRLLHPAYLAALALLLANDRLFKAAWPGPVSGKMSDFAGLIVLPVLLCVLFRVWDRRRAWGLHFGVGALFAFVQFTSLDGLFGLLGIALAHTPDPTDLVALAVLPVGVALSVRQREPVRLWRQRPLARAVLALSVVAVLGTSRPLPPEMIDAPIALHSADTAEAAFARVEAALIRAEIDYVATSRQTWNPETKWDEGEGQLRAYEAAISHPCSRPTDSTTVAKYAFWVGWNPETRRLSMEQASLYEPCTPEPIGESRGREAWRELFRQRIVEPLREASGALPISE